MRVDFRGRGREGFRRPRKRMTREGERCERVAWPKLFGAAGRESARPMRSAKVVDPPPRFGSGGTGDLDTNRGPPIPTPNAKKPTGVRTCVYVRNFHSLECSLCDAKNDAPYPSREMRSWGNFSRFSRIMKGMKILIVKYRRVIFNLYDESSFYYVTAMALTG